jgi:hypothetical protein
VNDDQIPTDLDKLKVVFEKHLEQGGKMESLIASEEWRFLVDFLEKVYDRMQKHVMEPNLVSSSQRQEDFSRGAAKAIRIFIDTPQKFIDKKVRAEKELVRREQPEGDYNGSAAA